MRLNMNVCKMSQAVAIKFKNSNLFFALIAKVVY